LVASDSWMEHMTRADLHLQGSGAVRGATGALVMERMTMWTKALPA
jgi:hypothetical protein